MLNEITNFYPVTDGLGTSGMPKREQFGDIAAAGYQLIINLAVPESTGQLSDEADLAHSLGMDYIHIPVVWQRPQAKDLESFFQAMDANQERRIFVHCVANYRVSAFVYLYRILRQGVPQERAIQDLNAIWKPDGIWADFILDRLHDKQSP